MSHVDLRKPHVPCHLFPMSHVTSTTVPCHVSILGNGPFHVVPKSHFVFFFLQYTVQNLGVKCPAFPPSPLSPRLHYIFTNEVRDG